MPETTFTDSQDLTPDPAILAALHHANQPVVMPVPGDEPSMLDQLKQDLRNQVSAPRMFPVPSRDGYALRCRTDLSSQEMQTLFKRASKGRNTTDNLLLAKLTLAQATLAIHRQGKALIDDKGDEQTFSSEAFMTAVGCPPNANVVDAVALFVGRDGDITALFDAVVDASGYGKKIDSEDLNTAADPTSSVS